MVHHAKSNSYLQLSSLRTENQSAANALRTSATTGELAMSLLHTRAQLRVQDCGMHISDYRHVEGIQIIDATLKAIAEQLRDQA